MFIEDITEHRQPYKTISTVFLVKCLGEITHFNQVSGIMSKVNLKGADIDIQYVDIHVCRNVLHNHRLTWKKLFF